VGGGGGGGLVCGGGGDGVCFGGGGGGGGVFADLLLQWMDFDFFCASEDREYPSSSDPPFICT